MNAYITIRNSTYYVYFIYRDAYGIRKQKWFNTQLGVEGNKEKVTIIRDELFQKWGPLLEPMNSLAPRLDSRATLNNFQKPSYTEEDTDGKILFADVLLEWLACIRPTVQVSTHQIYTDVVKGIIEPYFRERMYSIEEITVVVLEEYHDYILETGRSISTLRKHNSNIASALNYAIKQGWINFNPAYIVTMSRKIRYYNITYYEIDDLEILFRKIKDDTLWLVVILAAYYGMRRSEIIGLTWDAINWDKKTITVKQAAYNFSEEGVPSEQRIKKELKSQSSYRTLPLMPEVEFALNLQKKNVAQNKRWYGKSYNKKFDNMICVDKVGNWIKLDFVTNHFREFLIKNKLKKIRFHDLRHTFATIAYNNGVDLLMLKEWLGHADIQTTTIYSHLSYLKHIETAAKAQSVLPKIVEKYM